MRTRPEGLHDYQRLTRPTLETVSTSTCVPRRNTTFMLETPQVRPVGPKTTSGLDTSTLTPRDRGPCLRSVIGFVRRKARKRGGLHLTRGGAKRYLHTSERVALEARLLPLQRPPHCWGRTEREVLEDA